MKYQVALSLVLSLPSLSRGEAPIQEDRNLKKVLVPTSAQVLVSTPSALAVSAATSGCCSWDYRNCGSDAWCNGSATNCAQCNGFFIFPDTLGSCLAMWTSCSVTAECCGKAQCLTQADGWRHCNLPSNLGLPESSPSATPTRAPTRAPLSLASGTPTRAPTRSPTRVPTRAPTRSPTRVPTRAPTRSPTRVPTRAPTRAPTVAPFSAPSNAPTRTPTRSPTRAPTNPSPTVAPTRLPTPAPQTSQSPTSGKGCCSWDYGNCGPDVWCNESAANCAQCSGFFIYPDTQVGCLPMWTSCSTTAQCCGKAICLTWANGWRNCNLPESPTTPPAPTLPQTLPSAAPLSKNPTPAPTPPQPLPTVAPVPTLLPTTPNPSGIIGPDNNSERITLPRPLKPLDSSQQTNCPHNEGGLVDWISLFSPVPNQSVNIPLNTRVVIRQSVSTKLGVIDIPPSSELIIGENANGITLDVAGIAVRGKFTIGSETCRIKTKVTITLHGSRPANAVTNVPNPTYKGIDVNGNLSLHGKRFFHTWTRLATTARPGDTSLRLQEDVNWEAGQEIVLVSTAMKDSKEWHQNEVLRVQSVDNSPAVGSIVYLQSAIVNKHVGIQAYQAEVGLLTRVIVVQGSAADSEPTDANTIKCNGRWIHGNTDEPCPNTGLTGFGGHIIIRDGGRGFVEGVELFRMGQTNVLGRYPIHFHLLNDCPECYFRDSSVHRSFYRCVSIHGTNYVTVSENVAFDVAGFCYYLEDGVEQYNKIHFNLAAHIHMIGPQIPHGGGQTTQIFTQSNSLTLPADVAASGFYITNVRNEVIGNAASGGWAGFAFPNLPGPLGPHRGIKMRPSSVVPLDGNKLDGNTAHSSGWWWYHAATFYFGGALYYNGNNVLEYNPGRSFNFADEGRDTCKTNLCEQGDCRWCPTEYKAWLRLTNSKAFLTPSVGLGSWSGRMEVLGFECHDCGLSIESLEAGFWIDNMLANCRTGEPLNLPPGGLANDMGGNGFVWYDTDQEHIITGSTFRNCGSIVGSNGCDSNASTGCRPGSSVFGFLTHSSQFNPEIMQGTKGITFEKCGRRFLLNDFRAAGSPVSVSARLQNWLDEDGSITGFGQRSVIASALGNGMWWQPDRETVYVPEGPVNFFKLTSGPERGLGHVSLIFDANEHAKVGSSVCTNGGSEPCPALGYIKHIGPMFAADAGLPVTAQADIAGPVGGFGWLLKFIQGVPRTIQLQQIEVRPDTPLMLNIAYPPGTTFDIFAMAPYCWNGVSSGCKAQFTLANSAAAVRNASGNTYFMSSAGLLTIRVVQFANDYIGANSRWVMQYYNSTYPSIPTKYVLDRFERGGVLLPKASYGAYIQITATGTCGGGTYCSQSPPALNPNPCPSGFEQVAFDKCCLSSQCICANGDAC